MGRVKKYIIIALLLGAVIYTFYSCSRQMTLESKDESYYYPKGIPENTDGMEENVGLTRYRVYSEVGDISVISGMGRR